MPSAIQLTIPCLDGDGGSFFFHKHGVHIKSEITGGKKYSKDLEQGGLEILLDWQSAIQTEKWKMSWKKTEPPRWGVQKNQQ